jgi:FHS family L-fucose permease-like MFS transporter
MKVVRADYLMAAFAIGAVITNIFIIAMKTTATPYALLVLMFFESIMFPTIFSLGTKHLGRNHKRGSALSKLNPKKKTSQHFIQTYYFFP